jgi:hypothetical protein
MRLLATGGSTRHSGAGRSDFGRIIHIKKNKIIERMKPAKAISKYQFRYCEDEPAISMIPRSAIPTLNTATLVLSVLTKTR